AWRNRLCARRAAGGAPCRCARPRPGDAVCRAGRRGASSGFLGFDDVLGADEGCEARCREAQQHAIQRIGDAWRELLQREEHEVARATRDLDETGALELAIELPGHAAIMRHAIRRAAAAQPALEHPEPAIGLARDVIRARTVWQR